MAEMNAYLTQLEAEGQAEAVYGKGVQLIVPEPWFVVKTKDESGANRVYINICTSPKVSILSLVMQLVVPLQRSCFLRLCYSPAQTTSTAAAATSRYFMVPIRLSRLDLQLQHNRLKHF
jgi:hypothetical protein